MKKLLFMVLFISVVGNIDYAQTWRQATNYQSQSLTEIFMLNENLGWVCGGSGLIYKTTNGGVNWRKIESPVNVSLYSVMFIDELHGFIGADKRILVSNDGGETWSIKDIPGAAGSIKGVYFSDANNGQVLVSATAGGQIFRTNDGGNTWTLSLQATKDLYALSFYSPTNGVCTGKDVSTLYYTKDGINWVNAPAPQLGGLNYTRSDIWGVCMASQNVVYGTGWGSRAAGLQPTIHIKSTDGGATWVYQNLPEAQRTYVNFEDVYFINEEVGFSMGGSGSYEGGVLLKTTDGGNNWSYVPTNLGFPINSMTGVGNKLWIAGDYGCIAYSSNFGETWTLQNKIPSSYLYNISFAGNNTIFAGGFNGAYLRSTNGGNNWYGGFVVVNNKSPKISAVQFLNQNVGYMARSYNIICKTTDGGESWVALTRDTSDLNFAFNGLHFLDENVGFVCGKVNNQVLKTTDGGATWTQLLPNAGVDLNDVYFTDINNGVVVGKNRAVKYTTDGGATWNSATLNNIPAGAPATAELKDVAFVNSNLGYIAGVLNFKTTDGGKTWNYLAIPDPTKTMNNVNVFDNKVNLTGANLVYESNDEGVTWRDINDPNIVQVATLYGGTYDNNGYPWVVGSYSLIYTLSPFVDVKPEISLNNFSLEQNYPNPFNPNTTINYSVQNLSIVNLSVYNLLGQKVAELVNSEQAAGKYSVNFDASNLSSGVYFYTLTVGNSIATKKMVLIK